MINFSGIKEQSLAGRMLRALTRLMPSGTVVRILQGRLRGKKWIKGSGVNGYWLGSYEIAQQRAFEQTVLDGDIVFDIGANVGLYSLLASELVGPRGRVFAFEPLPRNFDYLVRHSALNGCHNIVPIQRAVSRKGGSARFKDTAGSAEGHLVRISSEGTEVSVVSLDELLERNEIPAPTVLKIDVEGEEFNVLRGAAKLLRAHAPIIFLSTHERDGGKSLEYLASLGYTIKKISGDGTWGPGEILAIPRTSDRM